jgi:hypothetical protein
MGSFNRVEEELDQIQAGLISEHASASAASQPSVNPQDSAVDIELEDLKAQLDSL